MVIHVKKLMFQDGASKNTAAGADSNADVVVDTPRGQVEPRVPILMQNFGPLKSPLKSPLNILVIVLLRKFSKNFSKDFSKDQNFASESGP